MLTSVFINPKKINSMVYFLITYLDRLYYQPCYLDNNKIVNLVIDMHERLSVRNTSLKLARIRLTSIHLIQYSLIATEVLAPFFVCLFVNTCIKMPLPCPREGLCSGVYLRRCIPVWIADLSNHQIRAT